MDRGAMPHSYFNLSGGDISQSALNCSSRDMSHGAFNLSSGDRQNNDNDGGSSALQPMKIGEVGNAVAADGDGSSISPQPYQTEAPIGPGDHNANTTGGALRKYVGVSRPTGKWISGVFYNGHQDERKSQVHVGTFPTAEMAAIAYDAAVLLLRGDTNATRLNFPEYSVHIKSILKGCSPSETVENIKYVGWKAAEELAPLISVGNKVRGFEVSPHVSVQPKRKDQGLEAAVTIPGLLVSPTKDISDSIRKADFQLVPLQGKQRMKVSAGAEGNITAGITSAPNLPTKIHDDQQETMTRINQQIQHGQPTSNTKGAADSNNISSFLLVPELLHKCSSPVDTTQNHFNQPIQRGQSRSKTSSATDSGTPIFSFMDKLLQESTTVASTAQNNNNHQMQHEQPFSNTHGAADNIISSFSSMYGRVNEGSTLVDTAQNYNNQHIQHDQPFSNISSFLFMDEPLYECSTEASWAQNNNNQQIQHEQPFSNISSFSLMHGTVDTAQNDINQQIESLHELSTLVDTTVQNDMIRKADFQLVPVQGKQRLKASAGAAGNITAGITSAPNLPTKIHYEQETMTGINQQVQHGQPNSNTKGAADSNNISSFFLMPELLHNCSSPVDPTQNHINQPIQRGQSRSKTSSATDSGTPSFSFMDELLHESTTVANTAQNNNNHQMQHEQPFSNPPRVADNIISSFSLKYGPVNESSTLVDTAQNDNNQQIQHDQPFSNISSFLFMDEPLYECSTVANPAQNNNNQLIQHEQPFNNISSLSFMHGTVDTAENHINRQIESLHELSTLVDSTVQNDINQQIEPVQRTGNTSRGTADSGISSFSLVKKTLHEFSIQAGSVQDGTFPTSNAHSMPKKVESFSELIDVEKDYSMDYGILMEYPLRHSPECVLLKPVPGANTLPDYLWKKQQLGQLNPCSKK